MAIANLTTLWHITDTAYASDTAASGCFKIGSAGTNKSYQTAIQRTDLLIDSVSALKVSSVLEPFTASDEGNYLWIPSGVTGFTSNRYCVQSVSAGVATLDASPGALNTQQTNGIIYLGGAMRSPGGCAGAIGSATYQTVYWSGVHVQTSDTLNVSGGRFSQTEGSQWLGYHAVPGDDVFSSTMLPVFTKGSFTNPLFSTATSSQLRNVRIEATHNSQTLSILNSNALIERCWINGSRGGDGGGGIYKDCYMNWVGVSGAGNSFDGVNGTVISGCTVILFGPILGSLVASNSIFYRTATGVLIRDTIATSSRWSFQNCTLVTADGFIFNGQASGNTPRNMEFNNCILYNEKSVSPDPVIKSDENYAIRLRNCAYPAAAPPTHTVTSALLPNVGGVALAAHPLVNPAGGNFALTETAKGLLRLPAAEVPGLTGITRFGWVGAEPIAPASSGSKPALLGGAQYGY